MKHFTTRLSAMIVESNIRKPSRMGLVYTCIERLAVYVNKTNASALPAGLKYYINYNGFNRMVYHQHSTGADKRMKQPLTDADKLLALCESGYNGSTVYDLFVRYLAGQAIVENEKRRFRRKSLSVLQKQ